MFWFPQQINPILPRDNNVDCTKIVKDSYSRGPFLDELSGMAMVKILDMKEQTTNMIKLKFIRNKAMLKNHK